MLLSLSLIVCSLCLALLQQVSAFRLNPRFSSRHMGLNVVSIESFQTSYTEILGQIKAKISSQASGSSNSATAQLMPMMTSFLEEYAGSNLDAKQPPELFADNILTFFKSVQEALTNPYQFSPHHQAIRQPFDYYKWGNDFLRPLVIMEQSKLEGLENAQRISQLVKKGENVVILSNHQTEADPQVISILLEAQGLNELAEKVIFVAGHKVTNDPVAIPFSMGRNLICIHSKKHIKNPPEDMPRKQAENLQAMQALGGLMAKGGQVFWVAPSGGRDRPNEEDKFVVAPFDLKALDMFKLVAMQSNQPTHFFPMAMYTHQLVPPPKTVSSDLGETRSAKRGAVSVTFLPETDGLGGLKDKAFLSELQRNVEKAYAELCAWHDSRKSL